MRIKKCNVFGQKSPDFHHPKASLCPSKNVQTMYHFDYTANFLLIATIH